MLGYAPAGKGDKTMGSVRCIFCSKEADISDKPSDEPVDGVLWHCAVCGSYWTSEAVRQCGAEKQEAAEKGIWLGSSALRSLQRKGIGTEAQPIEQADLGW